MNYSTLLTTMLMSKMKSLYVIILLMLTFSACKEKNPATEEQVNTAIELSKEQFSSEKIELGFIRKMLLEKRVHFSGKVVSTMDGLVIISSPIEGIVEEVEVYKGQSIDQNAAIVKIGGTALIELQKDFATSSAKIDQLKSFYERAKKLFEENINTENEFLSAKREYISALAENKALALKLKQIGVDTQYVNRGEFTPYFILRSPIAGQISQLSVFKGQHVIPETDIAEVVNKHKSELQLSLFENDFPRIKVGQTVYLSNLNSRNFDSKASITRIGSILSSNSNTLACYASFSDDSYTNFVINQMIHGEVLVDSDSIWAVPIQALVSQGNENFVLALEKETETAYQFKKINVKVGRRDQTKIELLNFDRNIQIVWRGADIILP